nr:phosphotransferase [Micromonospora sp. DSM 115978]
MTTAGGAPDLGRDYGLRVDAVRPHPGGFESDCLVIDATWFVKIWRRSRPPARLGLLPQLAALGLPVPAPVPTRTGELHAWWNRRPYAVFPFVRGQAAGDDDWWVAARALKRVHELDGIELPRGSMDEPEIWQLQDRLDHPWIVERRHEVAENIQRLRGTIERARKKVVRRVVCHRDFGGSNLLVDNEQVAAILDWDQAILGPREHDLWVAARSGRGELFLAEYGASDLDLDHIEYALLARALGDMAARVLSSTDRPGVHAWGFRQLARLDRDLALFRPFCR